MTDVVLDSTSPEAAGDWYVDHNECMACGAPPVQAPDLMGFGEQYPGASLGGTQCYFRRQPTSPSEIERACVAAETSCCGAVRYRGQDAKIHLRLKAR